MMRWQDLYKTYSKWALLSPTPYSFLTEASAGTLLSLETTCYKLLSKKYTLRAWWFKGQVDCLINRIFFFQLSQFYINALRWQNYFPYYQNAQLNCCNTTIFLLQNCCSVAVQLMGTTDKHVSEKCTSKLPTSPVVVFAFTVVKLLTYPGKTTDCWGQC